MRFNHTDELLPLRAFRTLGRRLWTLEGKGSSAPAQPDYVGAANATSAGNKEAALTTGALNRPTQVNPYGQTTWSLKEGADANNPQPGDWIQTQTLSENQQNLLSSNEQTSLALSDLANKGVGAAGQVLDHGYDASNLPTAAGNINTDPNQYAAERQQVQDATYNRATQYYDDRYGKDENQLRTQLANQGLDEGSAAYANAMTRFNQDKSTAYADATDRAVLAGGQEQSRIQQDLVQALQQQQNRRNNQLQEDLTLRELPINEINALRTGTQVTNPQFSSVPTVGGYQGADLLGATAAAGNYNQQTAAAKSAAQSSANSTYGNLAASGLLAYYG